MYSQHCNCILKTFEPPYLLKQNENQHKTKVKKHSNFDI